MKFSVDSLDTPNGRSRVQKAQEMLFDACHESHHALIRLVDFLDSPPYKELIMSTTSEFKNSNKIPSNQWIQSVLDQYSRLLEEARNVREQTSNISEEFHRAIIDMPPRQLDEPRKLHE